VDLNRVAERVGRKRIWKLESMAVGMVGAAIVTRLIRGVFGTIRKDKSPNAVFDPGSSRFSWPDVLVWSIAGGVGLGIAKVFSARVAAFGWEVATGTRPPGSEETEPA